MRALALTVALSICVTAYAAKAAQLRIGTAIFLNQQGELLTNRHVVDGCKRLSIMTYEGKYYPASVVVESPTRDLAVIREKGYFPREYAWIRIDQKQYAGITAPKDEVIYGGFDLDEHKIIDVGTGIVVIASGSSQSRPGMALMLSTAGHGSSGSGVFEKNRAALAGLIRGGHSSAEVAVYDRRLGNALNGLNLVEYYSTEAIVDFLQNETQISFYSRVNPEEGSMEDTKQHIFRLSTMVRCEE